MTDYVAYYRVSTARPGKSRNGLDAQKAAVAEIIRNNGNTLLDEFEEVESGKRADRPALTNALRRCKATGATLIVAKLDRLSRNAAFLMTLRDSGVDFVAADMPEANTLTCGHPGCSGSGREGSNLSAWKVRFWISLRTF